MPVSETCKALHSTLELARDNLTVRLAKLSVISYKGVSNCASCVAAVRCIYIFDQAAFNYAQSISTYLSKWQH